MHCATHLVEHLDEEERLGLPLAAEYLSAEEWGRLPGHGLAAFDGDKVWLILGLIRERMNEEQRVAMLAHMPPAGGRHVDGVRRARLQRTGRPGRWWRCRTGCPETALGGAGRGAGTATALR